MKDRVDPNLKETTHSCFELLGHFGSIPPEDSDKYAIGTLKYENGLGQLEVTPHIYKEETSKNGGRCLVENNDDGILYGYLEDGTFVRLNKFKSDKWKTSIPGFSSIHYIITELDLSKRKFSVLNNVDIDHILVGYDGLSQYGAFVTPNPDNMGKNDKSGPVKIGETDDVIFYLSYSWKKVGNRINYNYSCEVELEIKLKNSDTNISLICKRIKNFLSIIDDSNINITSTRFLDKSNNPIFTHLAYSHFTKQNGKKNYENATVSFFNFDNYKDYLSDIINKIFDKDDQFNKLVENYLYNIEAQLTPDSALINYVNSIDIFMHGKKYSNGSKIKGLASKMKFWFRQFPDDLYGLFFDEDKKNGDDIFRSDFIQALVDTRDYLTHYDKQNSKYLLKDQDSEIACARLFRTMIRIFLLFSYGIPTNLIKNNYQELDIKNFVNNIEKILKR